MRRNPLLAAIAGYALWLAGWGMYIVSLLREQSATLGIG